MSLKITPDPQFKAEVGITIPGKEEPVKVNIIFKYMTRKQYLSFIEGEKEKPLADSLAKVIKDWEGFDEPFNTKNLAIFLDHYPAAPLEIWTEYNNQLFASRVKN